MNLYDSRLKKLYQEPGKREYQHPGNGKGVSEPEKKQEKKKEAKEDPEEQTEGKGKKAAPRKKLGVRGRVLIGWPARRVEAFRRLQFFARRALWVTGLRVI